MSDFNLDPSVMNLFPSGATITPQVIAKRDPSTADNQYDSGTFWFNTASISLFSLLGFVSGVPQWSNVSQSLGNLTSSGNLNLTGASSRIQINDSSPSTSSVGTSAALVAGAGTVTTTAITANSKVLFTTNTLGTVTVPQSYSVSARTPGVSFTIQSSDATDTSTVDYVIIN